MIDGGLRPLFRQHLRRGFDWQSVETGGTGSGVPDSNFCTLIGPGAGIGIEGWVEYKKTDAWAVGLATFQVGWHLRRWRYGGWTLIAVRRQHDGGPRKGAPVDELWVYEGRCAAELATHGLQCTHINPLGVWSGGPASWNWDEVAACLRGERTAR